MRPKSCIFDRIRQPSWTYSPGQYGFYSYTKPELALRTLEHHLGAEHVRSEERGGFVDAAIVRQSSTSILILLQHRLVVVGFAAPSAQALPARSRAARHARAPTGGRPHSGLLRTGDGPPAYG